MRHALLSWLSACTLFAVAAVAAPPEPAKQPGPADLVATQEGELPLLLCASHGGREEVPGVPERKGEGLPKGSAGFFTGRDVRTEELALELAGALKARTGKKPYYVIARFSRKFIDADRPAPIAYESPAAKPVYDYFHEKLSDSCKAIQQKFGRGLLLDLHSQGTATNTVFRGTLNGKSVTALTTRFGAKALDGPESLCGLLAAAGWKVDPKNSGKERAGFTGGYIVQTYGSHTGHGIDAIELNLGSDFREKKKLKETAATLAEALEKYAARYLSDNGSKQ